MYSIRTTAQPVTDSIFISVRNALESVTVALGARSCNRMYTVCGNWMKARDTRIAQASRQADTGELNANALPSANYKSYRLQSQFRRAAYNIQKSRIQQKWWKRITATWKQIISKGNKAKRIFGGNTFFFLHRCVYKIISKNYLLTIRFFFSSFCNSSSCFTCSLLFLKFRCLRCSRLRCNVLLADVHLALGCPQSWRVHFFFFAFSLCSYVRSVVRRLFELESVASVSVEKDFER